MNDKNTLLVPNKEYAMFRELQKLTQCQFCGQPTADEKHKGKNWCGRISCLDYYYSRHRYE